MQATFAKTRDQCALQIEALQCHGIVSWRHCTLVAALEATEFFSLIFSGDAKKYECVKSLPYPGPWPPAAAETPSSCD